LEHLFGAFCLRSTYLEVVVKQRHIRDMAEVYAALDKDSGLMQHLDWDARYEWHYDAIEAGRFDPYSNLYDMGYERMAFAFQMLHTIETMMGER
jgi:hypothetical protein